MVRKRRDPVSQTDTVLTTAATLVWQSAPFLIRGAVTTLGLAVGSMLPGLILGFGLALMRRSRIRAFSAIARFYVSFIRGTPLLVQLFVIYYGLPQLGINLDPIPSALIGFSLNTGGYTAEIWRSAISAVERGQTEAAAALGMTPALSMALIVMPQAVRIAVPPLGNSFMSLLKDTALAATIQVPELFRQAQLITARTYQIFAMYLAAASLYWLMSGLFEHLQFWLERHSSRHLSYGHRDR